MRLSLFYCLLFVSLVAAEAADYYADPGATSGVGTGSLASPWNLQIALTNTSVLTGGDTVWLRGGTYFPPSRCQYMGGTNVPPEGGYGWTVRIIGATNDPITIRSYPGEWAQIDRPIRIVVAGNAPYYLRWRDIEFFDSIKGFDPGNPAYGEPRPWIHFDDAGPAKSGAEWINCVVHDINMGWASRTAGFTIRGCIVWHSGQSYIDHLTYPMGENFIGNIVAWNTPDVLNNSQHESTLVTSNILFGTGVTLNGTTAGRDIVMTLGTQTLAYNRFYQAPFPTKHHSGAFVGGVVPSFVISNTWACAIPIQYGSTASTFVGNSLYMNQGDASWVLFARNTNSGPWVVNSNAYWSIIPREVKFETVDPPAIETFAQWKASNPGFDTASTSTNSTVPVDSVHVIPNEDEARRAHIAVYNWSGADNVVVSLSGVLEFGDSYRLYSAQNYLAGAIQAGTYNGTSISVPMTNLTTAPVIYFIQNHTNTITQAAPTSPTFAAFVVKGAAAAAAAVSVNAVTVNVGTIVAP